MSLVVYVSGHGLGHATREISLLQHLPANIPLVIKTVSPEWHWRNELSGREFTYVPATFDVGTVQKDSLDSDAPGTLAAWRVRDAENRALFQSECEDLERRGARMIVTDVPSFPLTVASTIGIPSVCIANFTWADIYGDLARDADLPELGECAARLEEEYAQATLLLEAGFAQPMLYFPNRESVGLVARKGTERRAELLAALPDAVRDKRLALVYAGNWGLPIPYAKLAGFTDWHFLSLGAPDGELPANWSVVARDLMAHPDLVASVDLIVSKVGYGLVGECLTSGTPILYCPRTGFAEYPVIDAYLSARPHGIRLSTEAFTQADWGDVLASIPPHGTLPKETAPGDKAAAKRLTEL